MLRIKSRRARIRVFSFTAAALAAAVIFAAVGLTAAHRLKMAQEYSYERALCELDEHVDSIDIALKKSMYAGTSPQLISLCAQIWSDSSAAAADISEMPLTDVDMSATVKFLSQAGDYADTLARALSQGVGLTDDEKKTLAQLSSSASRLSAQLGVTQRRIQSGSITLFKADEVLRGANVGAKPAAAYVGDSLGKIEKTFSGLPSMIYDGPFSDSVFRKTPALTQGRPDIGSAAARQKAAAFLSRQPQELKSAGVSSGTLPTYDFTCGTVSISVAKSVGFIVRMADSAAAPARERLSRSDACAKAGEALKKFGADPAAVTYSLINGGVCTVSFACVKDNVIYYPDLIKAGVSLDDGRLVSFDATGYIMNHRPRPATAPKTGEPDARAKLNRSLKITKSSLAVIPTDGGGEALCYEYRCTAPDGGGVIDYISADTGAEQKLLILLDTPGGLMPT